MIRCENLSYQYAQGAKLEFPNVNCQKGERLLILGESGKGKTTLLHLMAGMLKPTTGQVIIKDVVLKTLTNSTLDKFRGKEVGLIFQTPHFVDALSVFENIKLAQFLSGKTQNDQKVFNILDRLNIKDKAHKKPKELSVGEKQRVSIARALINEPSIILADEPTSALDDVNTDKVIHLLEEQARISNASLIIVTHDNRLKAKITNCIEI